MSTRLVENEMSVYEIDRECEEKMTGFKSKSGEMEENKSFVINGRFRENSEK